MSGKFFAGYLIGVGISIGIVTMTPFTGLFAGILLGLVVPFSVGVLFEEVI